MGFINQIFAEENLIKMVTTIIPSLLVATLTPLLVIKISLRQFSSQKWWEAKAIAYSKIVESLSVMIYVQEQRFEHDVVSSINLNQDTLERYRGMASEAYDELRKAKGVGSYIISKDAIAALEALDRKLSRRSQEGDWQQDMNDHLGAMITCMDQLRDIAGRELKKGK